MKKHQQNDQDVTLEDFLNLMRGKSLVAASNSSDYVDTLLEKQKVKLELEREKTAFLPSRKGAVEIRPQ